MFETICYDKNGYPIDFFMQWDQNQYIYIHDYESTETPIVHFCNVDSKYAYAVGNESDVWIEGGTLICKVPNQILQENKMIFIYVYEYEIDTQSGRTIHSAKISVHSRKQPENMIFEENIEYIDMVVLNSRVKSLISSMESFETKVTALENRMDIAESNITLNVSNIASHYELIIKNQDSIAENTIAIQANADAISELKGTADGSISKQISDATTALNSSLKEYVDQKISEFETSSPTTTVTDDGEGNVTLSYSSLSTITDDGEGNVTITN